MTRLVWLTALFSGVFCAHGDHYATLGVTHSSTPEEIRKGFRREALRWHPDKHVGDSSQMEAQRKFELANEAWSVLSDPGKRQRYDLERTFGSSGGRYPSGAGFEQPRGYGRAVMRTRLACSLEEMGGWRPVFVTLPTVNGAFTFRRVHLPAGTQPGEVVGLDLPGCVPVEVRRAPLLPRSRAQLARPPLHAAALLCARRCVCHAPLPRPAPPSPLSTKCPLTSLAFDFFQATVELRAGGRFRPVSGADISRVLRLPPWHNLFKPQVRVGTICRQRPVLLNRGTAVESGATFVLPGYGMPIAGTGASAAECERGELRVRVFLRSPREQAHLSAVVVAGGTLLWASYHTVGGIRPLLRIAVRLLARTLRLGLGVLSLLADPRPSYGGFL